MFSTVGTVHIRLIAENEFACIDSISDNANIVGSMAVANAFSPHSNVEKNRIFYPIPLGMQLNTYEFKIYNRWGNLVFTTNDPEKGWDGSLLNGEIAQTGAFVWTVVYKDSNGSERKCGGTVLVVE